MIYLASFMVGIAGPACSGKSTVCNSLATKDGRILHIGMESFYKSNGTAPIYRGFRNLDSPKSIDFDGLFRALEGLKNGNAVAIPLYSKNESKIIGEEEVHPKPIILVEGFILFTERRIRDLLDLKVFVDVDKDTQKNRKLGRKDGNDLNLEYFNQVLLPMEKRYVAPTKVYADYVVDGSQAPESVESGIRQALKTMLR